MDRIRLDDIRSICYTLDDREFKWTTGQEVGGRRGVIEMICEDLWHLHMTNTLRYVVFVNNGNETKPWKVIPENARGVIIEQFL